MWGVGPVGALVYAQSLTEAKHKWLQPILYGDAEWFKNDKRNREYV